jgi:hypothetical protein
MSKTWMCATRVQAMPRRRTPSGRRVLAGARWLILDIAKGFLPTFLALKFTNNPWITALTAALAVQVIAGRSLPSSAAAWGWPPSAARCSRSIGSHSSWDWVCCLLLTLTIRHSARASVFTGILIRRYSGSSTCAVFEFWIALAGGLVIAYRFLIDWNRKYRELWLDREKP